MGRFAPYARGSALMRGVIGAAGLLVCTGAGDPLPGDSNSPPPVQQCYVPGIAFRTDHIALDIDECWASWDRPAGACTGTTLHTAVLDEPTMSFTAYASDDAGTPGAIKLATNAQECQARSLTMKVERRHPTTLDWITMSTSTIAGTWNTSTNTCTLRRNYYPYTIPPNTTRVRVTVQARRQDGSFAGTHTVLGYKVPGPHPQCVD